MDFATRDRYRHAVEEIARRSRLSEDEVARAARSRCAAARDGDRRDARTSATSWSTTAARALERALQMRAAPAVMRSLRSAASACALPLYVGADRSLITAASTRWRRAGPELAQRGDLAGRR